MTRNEDTCRTRSVNERKVESVRGRMPDEGVLSSVAETFKHLGDGTRARILYALTIDEMCVCDISTLLDMSMSAVSHQLRILRGGRLVKFRKEGKNVYYSLDDDHIRRLLQTAREHVTE